MADPWFDILRQFGLTPDAVTPAPAMPPAAPPSSAPGNMEAAAPGAGAGLLGAAADPMMQQDLERAQWGALGQTGALLLAAGQRLTPEQRASYLSQIGTPAQGVQGQVLNAAQARLAQAKAQETGAEAQQLRLLSQQMKTPGFAQKVGIDPALLAAMGPKELQNVLQARAAKDPLDTEYKQAQIEALKESVRDPAERERRQLEGTYAAREEKGKQIGLSGDDLNAFIATGKTLTQTEKAPTQSQADASAFHSRMVWAESLLEDPKKLEKALGASGAARRIGTALPVVGGLGVSPEYKQFENAGKAFLSAVLRDESGAQVTQQEWDRDRDTYFPTPWDDPATIAQKAELRRNRIEGMLGEASAGYRKKFLSKEIPQSEFEELARKRTTPRKRAGDVGSFSNEDIQAELRRRGL